jgi:hypothetical protein
MRNLIVAMALLAGMTCSAQTTDLFKPYKTTDLRLPSVPIVVSDPYFSIWSPYNTLNEGTTKHWTDAEKPITGFLRVDGKTYRFMGGASRLNLKTIVPMTTEEIWNAAFMMRFPGNGWQEPNFNDQNWRQGKAAFGSDDNERIHTPWSGDNKDIYIRRHFTLNQTLGAEDMYLIFSHDDVFDIYINGKLVTKTGETWDKDVKVKLTDEIKRSLQQGDNVIAAHCHNTTGGSYVDFGLYCDYTQNPLPVDIAIQKHVSVTATSSYYTFNCGPVELNMVFTAPQLIDDLDLLSTPINYISYQVKALDKKAHNVQIYVETTPKLAVNEDSQPTISSTLSKNGINYVKAGTIEQPICAKKGDGICIDWGYVYLAGINDENNSVSLGDYFKMKNSFVEQGKLLTTQTQFRGNNANEFPAMAYMHNFGNVTKAIPQSGFMMIGYDDIYSLEYMYQQHMAYWKHNGKVNIFQAFEKLRDNYSSIMERCRTLDQRIYDDAFTAGGKKYAEICSGSYRHVISAHKLFTDNNNNLLFFSKENNSNGCINTVDLTYPSAPLFLVYNPELEKAMLTSIFEYSKSGRWTKPFAAHDLGTYPVANGQVYGGDMPLEESGNMITLTAAICKIQGKADYAEKYWDILTTWTNYLVDNGQDPTNQLCTDDFAGHWAHNANLSIKAIMGIAGYSELAKNVRKE